MNDLSDAHHAANVPMDAVHPRRLEPMARRIPRRVQVTVISVGAGLLLMWLLVNWLISRNEKPAPPQGTASETFKPTEAQWAGFKTQTIGLVQLASTQFADGKIAIDDDLSTQVFSPYSGRVTKLFAKAGDHVRVGDPLFSVQASELVQGSNDLIAAMSTDRTNKSLLALAVGTEERQHALYLAQGGALKDWQQSQSDLENARGAFNTAEVGLGSARNRLRILGRTEREIADMERGTDLPRFNSNAIVSAPIAGTVLQRQVGLGQNIATQFNGGSTPVYTVGDTSRLWLSANVREVDASQVHLGDMVEVTVLALPARVFKARVTYVSATIDPSTHRMPIHAEISNADGSLKPEMFATFRIITGRASPVLAAPLSAVVFDAEGAHVWLAGADKTLQIRKVSTGRTDGDVVEIVRGLNAGDVVVTRGALFIDRAADPG